MPLRLTKFEFERLLARRKKVFPEIPPPISGKRWEDELAAQLVEAGYSGFVREHRFQRDRRFRFDFAYLPARLAIEIDGAVHRIKKRYKGDQEKGQLALLGDWRVLHVTPQQVRSGEAISLVKRLLKIIPG